MNTLPFIDCDIYGERRKVRLTRNRKHHELSPLVRARANSFQICKHYILQGMGIGVMPEQIIFSGEPVAGTIEPILPDWRPPPVDLHMIYPFQLSYSNLISAFYDTAREIITINASRAAGRAPVSGP